MFALAGPLVVDEGNFVLGGHFAGIGGTLAGSHCHLYDAGTV